MKYLFNTMNNELYYTWNLAPQVSALRDLFRYGDGLSQVVNQPLGSDWKVSDIGTYEPTIGLVRAFYFALRNTVSKVEYVFIIAGRMTALTTESDNPIYSSAEGEIFGWSTNVLNYMLIGNEVSGNGSLSNICPMFVLYNPDYTIASSTGGFGFDDAVELTYTGGDFTELVTPPTSEAILTATWLHSHCPKIMGLTSGTTSGGTSYNRIANFVIDDTSNFMKIIIYIASSTNQTYTIALFADDLFINSDPADTNTTGIVYSNFDLASTNANLASNLTYFNYGAGFNAAGSRDLFHSITSNQFSIVNMIATDNTIHWRRVQAAKNTAYKGYFNPFYVREAGEYNKVLGNGMRFLDPDTLEVYDVLHNGVAYIGDNRVPGLNYTTKNILFSASIFIPPVDI
jgi:hypothetical protein